MKRATWAIALATVTVIALTIPASALPKTFKRPRVPVVNSRASEYSPAADGDYVSWTASGVARPRRYRVYFSVDGGSRQRANPPGTKAWNGGIDGTSLVYYRFGAGDSDLVLYDMATETELALPAGVNTAAREYAPTISGNYLLFDRDDSSGGTRSQDIVLYNTSTDVETIVAHTESDNRFLQSGQVNGNWAVYFQCRASGTCDVYRYDIGGDQAVTVPNPGVQQYSPSVSGGGIVYFVRSQPACGQAVRYMVWDGASAPTRFNDFRPRRDSFDSFYDDATDSLYFEKIRCTSDASGIFRKPAQPA